MIIRIKDVAILAWTIQTLELKNGKVHVTHDGRTTIVPMSDRDDFETAYADWLNHHSQQRRNEENSPGINAMPVPGPVVEPDPEPEPKPVRKKKKPPVVDTEDE